MAKSLNFKKDVPEELAQRLSAEGYKLDQLSETETILHLWDILTTTEDELQLAEQNAEETKLRNSSEMAEVEQYVEHIRALSEEREALTVEFESENERLKGEAAELKQQLANGEPGQGAGDEAEIRDLLVQQGLDELIGCSGPEKIAYLLVDRARLMDELETEMTKSQMSARSVDTHDDAGRSERNRLEEEKKNHRKAEAKWTAKEKDFVAEIDGLQKDLDETIEEATRLENDLDIAQKKGLTSESTVSHLQEEKQLLEEEVEKVRGKLKQMTGEISLVNNELTSFQEENDALHEEIQIANKKCEADERECKSLKSELKSVSAQSEQYKEDLLSTDVALVHSKRKITELQKDLISATETVHAETNSSTEEISKLEIEVVDLRAQLDEAENKTNKPCSDCQRFKDDLCKIEDELSRTRQQLHAADLEFHEKERSYKERVGDLELRVTELASQEGNLKQAAADQENAKEVAYLETVADCQKLEEKAQEITDLKKELASVEMSAASRFRELLQEKDKDNKLLREKISRIDTERKDISVKLKEALKRTEDAHEDLHREKLKHATTANNEEQLLHLRKYTDNLEKEVNLLQEKLHEHAQQELSRITPGDVTFLQSQEVSPRPPSVASASQTVPEITVEDHGYSDEMKGLEQRLDTVRLDSKKQQDILREKLHMAELEIRILRETQQIALQDVSRVHEGDGKLKEALDAEVHHRTDVEFRCEDLETEIAKSLAQAKDLLGQKATLQRENQDLKEKVDKLIDERRDVNLLGDLKQTDTSKALKQSQIRADEAESLISELRVQVNHLNAKLVAAEAQCSELEFTRSSLHKSRDDLIQLSRKLEEASSNRSTLDGKLRESENRLSAVREKESLTQKELSELQHSVIDLEGQLKLSREEEKTYIEMVSHMEKTRVGMASQMKLTRKEVETLELELEASGTKLELFTKKYYAKMIRHKAKIQHARDLFNQEKQTLKDKVARVQGELSTVSVKLTQEQQWKTQLERRCSELSSENRSLLARQADYEEELREAQRSVLLLEQQVKHLDLENDRLQVILEAARRDRRSAEMDFDTSSPLPGIFGVTLGDLPFTGTASSGLGDSINFDNASITAGN